MLFTNMLCNRLIRLPSWKKSQEQPAYGPGVNSVAFSTHARSKKEGR